MSWAVSPAECEKFTVTLCSANIRRFTISAFSYDIERLIIHFPEVVARAAREFSPQHVAQYLTELAGAWNSFYAKEQVLGSPEEAYKQRLARAFANTMQNGLTFLGIPTPDKM